MAELARSRAGCFWNGSVGSAGISTTGQFRRHRGRCQCWRTHRDELIVRRLYTTQLSPHLSVIIVFRFTDFSAHNAASAAYKVCDVVQDCAEALKVIKTNATPGIFVILAFS